MSVQNFIKIG